MKIQVVRNLFSDFKSSYSTFDWPTVSLYIVQTKFKNIKVERDQHWPPPRPWGSGSVRGRWSTCGSSCHWRTATILPASPAKRHKIITITFPLFITFCIFIILYLKQHFTNILQWKSLYIFFQFYINKQQKCAVNISFKQCCCCWIVELYLY